MISETHANAAQRDLPLREIIKRARHDGCGGRAGRAGHRHRRRIQPPGRGRSCCSRGEAAADSGPQPQHVATLPCSVRGLERRDAICQPHRLRGAEIGRAG